VGAGNLWLQCRLRYMKWQVRDELQVRLLTEDLAGVSAEAEGACPWNSKRDGRRSTSGEWAKADLSTSGKEILLFDGNGISSQGQ